MRRRLTLDAEVVGRLDDSGAEELLPESVHDDAREQRIGAIDHPSREPEPISRQRRRHRRQERWRGGVDKLAGLIVHAAEEQMRCGFRVLPLFEHHRRVGAQLDLAMLAADARKLRRQLPIVGIVVRQIVKLQRISSRRPTAARHLSMQRPPRPARRGKRALPPR